MLEWLSVWGWHMVHLMPLPPKIGFIFVVPADQGSPRTIRHVLLLVYGVGASSGSCATVVSSQRQRNTTLRHQEGTQDGRRRRHPSRLLRIRLDPVRRLRVLHDTLRCHARPLGVL